ncbi:MAG: linear amide C-N hydrolase [Bacteroidales bacterium]|nr:linear amide C-N hydrolase [Bacteroidales bacterium]
MKVTFKRIACMVGLLMAVGFGVFVYGGWQMFGDQLRAISTLRMLQDRVYTFEYKGDYGFKAFLEQGGARTDADMAAYIAGFLSKGYMKTDVQTPEAGCSTIASDSLFCRNFDWESKSHYAVVRTFPDDGYASISTTGFAFLGMGEDWHPIAGMDGMTALASIYVPLDGMNEKGVCVSDLVEIDGSAEVPDTHKPDLTIVAAIRLVLDYAADAEEAVRLLSQYDVFPSVNAAHHLAISDINDNNVVVEWRNGEMRVTQTDVVTNHCLAEDIVSPWTEESRRRFAALSEHHSGFRTQDEGLQALKDAAYPDHTLWSVIYDKKNLTSTICFDRNWDSPLSFSIDTK